MTISLNAMEEPPEPQSSLNNKTTQEIAAAIRSALHELEERLDAQTTGRSPPRTP
jgi:hypothetical protein